MNGWHENAEDWHGPIDRQEIQIVWDMRSQSMVEKRVEYRMCGCIVWRDN